MDMRAFTKSMLTMPWALSMFSLQQAANLLSPSTTNRFDAAGRAMDDVAAAASHDFDGWARQTYDFGNSVQQSLVDIMMLRPPSMESGRLMRMVQEFQGNPMFQAMMQYGMPPVGWAGSLLKNAKDGPAVGQEFNNKIYVITLVTQVHAKLGLHDGTEHSLATMVAKAADMETYPRLWAVEGIGNFIGDRALAHDGDATTGLLTGPEAQDLGGWSMTMLHAGIGMSFAKYVLKTLKTDSPAPVVRDAITRFAALCRASSRQGYAGAAYESLGLATRTLYPEFVRLIDAQIPEVEPGLLGYYWHGVGRAMYFEPPNWMPFVNAPWRAIGRLDVEAPHQTARKNLLSGVAWALTMVNLRHPVVTETFLRHHGTLLSEDDAYTDGVTSSLTMRYDTTRDDAKVSPFIHHEPEGDPDLAALWRALITGPCEDALQRQYPQLRAAHQLEEIFHYRAPR